MGKGMPGSTYTGNSETEGGRELPCLRVVGKQGQESELRPLTVATSRYVTSLSHSDPISKMGIRILPGEESITCKYLTFTCYYGMLFLALRLATLATSFRFARPRSIDWLDELLPGLSLQPPLEIQSHISNCQVDIFTQLFQSHLRLNRSKTFIHQFPTFLPYPSTCPESPGRKPGLHFLHLLLLTLLPCRHTEMPVVLLW